VGLLLDRVVFHWYLASTVDTCQPRIDGHEDDIVGVAVVDADGRPRIRRLSG
jgi:hypothetical protein